MPVLKPNEAMFDAALETGGRVGMLTTFAPAVASMEEEFRDAARRRGSTASLETVCVAGARAALQTGELDAHDCLVAEAAAALAHCDAIMLAHFSMANAGHRVQARMKCPVLTAPRRAVIKLRSTLVAAGV